MGAVFQLSPKDVNFVGHVEEQLSFIHRAFLQPVVPLLSLNSLRVREGALPTVGEILATILPIDRLSSWRGSFQLSERRKLNCHFP